MPAETIRPVDPPAGEGRIGRPGGEGQAAGTPDIHESYRSCILCPRRCRVDRNRGRRGYCGESTRMRIAWAGLHRGEEPPLIGKQGSGTIFFSGCTLKCGGCQNCQLSRQGLGRELSGESLAELMVRLQERGAENINVVTASHFAPSVVESVETARRLGLTIPVVWNSSGYEEPATLERLKGTADVYLPDCKTLDPNLSRELMGAADYPEVAKRALLKMVGEKTLGLEQGRIRQGVIVRHLVLPGLLASSRQVLEWFARHLRDRALLSLMFQYTPVLPGGGRAGGTPQRTVNRREYEQVLRWLGDLGIEDGFLQEPATGSDWLPDFTRKNPFPRGQAVPVWHFRSGYLG